MDETVVVTSGDQFFYVRDELADLVPEENIVTKRSRAQNVKPVAKELRENGRPEADVHKTVHKPWGYYTSLETGDRHQVKRLCLKEDDIERFEDYGRG